MSENRDYLEMAFKSIHCFSDDGRLDADELGKIVAIAERDGVIDEDERRVLTRIIARIQPDEIDAAMKQRLAQIQKAFETPAA